MLDLPVECPKCGKRTIIQRGPDLYQCLSCDFTRDFSEAVATTASQTKKPPKQRQETTQEELSPLPIFILGTAFVFALFLNSQGTSQPVPQSPKTSYIPDALSVIAST